MAQRVYARLRRGAIVLATAAIGIGLVPAVSAVADPVTETEISQPATAADAKQAWLTASEQAEALNEQVLLATEGVETSAAAVTVANDQVTAAIADVAAAQQAQTAAQTVVDSYDAKLDAFANASFRGARLNQLSSLLTSDSADDFLDSVSALDRVAGDTSAMLQDARDAKTAADAAAIEVETKKSQAETAQQGAVTANTEAVAAQAALTGSKAELDAKVAQFETLYNELSEQERLAAIAAEQARLAALAAAAAQAAAAAAAAAPADATTDTDATNDDGDAAVVAAPKAAAAPSVPSVSAPNSAAQAAVDAALSKVGSRYVFGAAGPDAFDCSGLTSWAWKQAGVSIPRTSSGQAGLTSVPMDQLQPGDLVTYYSPVHHVAMYIGNGQIVHASTSSKPVYVTSVNYGGPNASGHRVG